MGHYAAEMQCDTCAQDTCAGIAACPSTSENHWVIAENYKVMKANKFQQSAVPMGFYHRMSKVHYKSKKEALAQVEKNKIEDLAAARKNLDSLEKQLYPDLPSTKEKIDMYEGLLHDIQLFSAVVMDGQKVEQLIRNINHWSYAHRCGNGEYSDEEQAAIVAPAFKLLRKR